MSNARFPRQSRFPESQRAMARVLALAATLIAISSLASRPAPAATKNWIDGTGFWTGVGGTGSNWSPAGVPVASDTVNIVLADGVAHTVTYDYTGAVITLNPVTVDLTGAGAASTTLSIPAGNLTSVQEVVGSSGSGAIDQSGGTNANTGMYLGLNSGSSGTYTLSGGLLSSSFTEERIGSSGTGIFNQSGGTNTTTASIILGFTGSSSGTYTLSSGVVHAFSEALGYQATATGTFNQTGGTNTGSTDLSLGVNTNATGTYNLSGGSAIFGGNAYVAGNAGVVGGSGVLNVSGTGALTLGSALAIFNRPNTSVNFSGGTINAATLNFNGLPSLFNWTGGKLNLTSSVTFDSAAAATSTSSAFGPSLTLGSDQTLAITGNEGLGGTGAFTLMLNSGSTHLVTGGITLSPTGTITQNDGSTLYAATFTQAGGTVNGTLQNQGTFTYQSGLFNGRLLNQGTANPGTSFTAGNGIENDGAMTVTAGQTLTVNGAGLDNVGTFTLSGGIVSGGGPVLNDFGGTIQARGTINPVLTNNGLLSVSGALTLTNGTAATNNGILQGSGTIVGNIINAAGGAVNVAPGNPLAFTSGWSNAGLVALQGAGAVLNGGTIANMGTIQGAGRIGAPVANSAGVIRASGGELDLAGSGSTNDASGLIQAATGNTVLVLQGLAANDGTIGLSGGTFDNNNQTLSNSSTGVINGYGTVRTGGLTNTGRLNVGEGNMDVFGAVINNGTIGIQGGRSIYFFGNVSGLGSYTGLGTATFLAAVSPGNSPASVSFGGNVNLTSSSSLKIELGGVAPGSQYDQLHVSGQLALGGALAVSLINSFTPAAGESFDILDWGSLSGSFSSLLLPTLGGGLTWNTSQLYTTGVLSVVAPVSPATTTATASSTRPTTRFGGTRLARQPISARTATTPAPAPARSTRPTTPSGNLTSASTAAVARVVVRMPRYPNRQHSGCSWWPDRWRRSSLEKADCIVVSSVACKRRTESLASMIQLVTDS